MSFAGGNLTECPREEDGRSGPGILLGEGDRAVVTVLSVPMSWIWSDNLTFDSMQSRVQSYVTVLLETYLKLQQLFVILRPIVFVPNDWLHLDSLQPVQTLSRKS